MSVKSPFEQGLFFPSRAYTMTLEALKKGVVEGASLITCIGGEGCGKSLLCRALEQEFSPTFLVVSFPYSVESYDYVVQIISLKLQLVVTPEDEAMGASHLLLKIAETLRAEGRRLLVLFDEAEKLYLATLERIRKMLDLVNDGEENLLQIVFFGREGLQPHLEQLALCSFQEVRTVHLALSPLTEEEVFQYIQACLQQNLDEESAGGFSREAIAKIVTLSAGNFRKINKMAGDALKVSLSLAHDSVGVVSPEHVLDPERLSAAPPCNRRLSWPRLAQGKMLGAAAALVGVVLLFIFMGNRDQAEPKKEKAAVPERQMSANEPPKIAATTQSGTEKNALPPSSVPAPPTITPQTDLPSSHDPVVAAPPVSPAPPVITKPAPASPPAAKAVVDAPVIVPAPLPVPSEAKVAVKTSDAASPSPASVETSLPKTVKPAPEPPTLHADKRPVKKDVVPHLSSEPVAKKIGSNSPETGPLTQKSIAAGEQWRSGKKNDLYTLQLMVLGTDKAEEKLKSILQGEKERKGGAGFVLLKKTTSPATVTLFYGEFSSLAEAKAAQSSLPPSLQKNNPYPVSIKKAVDKSK